jgi:hypothetical protein
MIIGLLLSFATSTALGVLLLRRFWPHGVASCPLPLAAALGVGLGAGLSSIGLFLWLLTFGPVRGFPMVETAMLVLVALTTLRRPGTAAPERRADPEGERGSRRSLLVPAFLVTLAATAAAFASMLLQEPHGEWDAWMNWDMRARMIFLGGETWRTAFSPALPWSHPDYPVLVPSLVVRAWLYAGMDTLAGPALVAATFAFGTVALLVAALAALRRPSQGLLAGMVLLSTPFFVRHATSLYADVPLGFFFLATAVCLALDGRHGATRRFATVAGFCAGLAMWTKNEGMLFTIAMVAGLMIAGRGEGRPAARSRLIAFGAGLLPVLLVVIGFKIAFAPPNDLLSTLGIERTLGRVTSPERYLTVLRAYVVHIGTFGNNGLGGVVWVLALCFAALGLSREEIVRPWLRAAGVGLILLLTGHFMVFVSMADELSRLLQSSLDRLLLQLWPTALFLGFMASRSPEEVGAERVAAGRPVLEAQR